MTSPGHPAPIPAPWMLIDDLTVDQTADLLERLTSWLIGPAAPDTADTDATGRCARALSLGETDDPTTLASWADALAARLRRLAQESQLDPGRPTINLD
ncbi:MAG: hypothetical protein ACRDPR_12120 [Nocardioidaceae bacterium]